jgi:hypothetical protein
MTQVPAHRWVLVDPIASPRPTVRARRAGRRRQIRTVGFFSNSKQHAAEIEEAIAGSLGARHRFEARFYRKPNASVGGAPELLENIATECDAVFTGSGD